MNALVVASVLIMLITALMLAAESYDAMRNRARQTRRAERGLEKELYRQEHVRRHLGRVEEEQVQDLRLQLDLYGVTGFLYLDEQRREEDQ